MTGIVYVSEAVFKFDEESLRELEDFATKRNAEIGVTGYLCFEDGKFLQYIEGEPDAVAGLMVRIAEDPRHVVLNRLVDDSVSGRRFPTWHMRWLRRRYFVGLERILTEHLVLMKNAASADEALASTVWRMVDKTSEVQAKLSTSVA